MAPGGLQVEHRLHLDGHRLLGPAHVLLGTSAPQLGGLGERQPTRDVSVQRVVRRRLVGHEIRNDVAPDQLRVHVGCVADDRDGSSLLPGPGRVHLRQRVVEVAGDDVQIAVLDPAASPVGIHLHAEEHRPVHRRGQRLRSAHAPEAAGEHQPAREVVASEVRPAGLRECLVGALKDPLRADVDPRPGRHLAVHHQALRLELAEHLPGGPPPDQVRVRDENPRGIGMGPEHAHRLARLDEHRLVVAQRPERRHHPVERGPVPGGLPGAAVDHQVFGTLGHLGVEVVHQHPQGGLLHPAAAAALGTPGGPDRPSRHRLADLRRGAGGGARRLSYAGRREHSSPPGWWAAGGVAVRRRVSIFGREWVPLPTTRRG